MKQNRKELADTKEKWEDENKKSKNSTEKSLSLSHTVKQSQ